MIRVLIAEDQLLLREALADILARYEDLRVVAQVGRGDEVLAAALQTEPDVALLDIEMPGMDGLTAAGQLHDRLPNCHALILTVFGRPGYLRRALDQGAIGFVLKDASPSMLVDAVRRTAAGERVIDPQLAVATLEQGENPLTPREREILAMSASGSTAGELAQALNLSQGTVRNHLSLAIQKLHARTRLEAIRIAQDKGWL
ncbi:MAG: response regulator transcription factor [Chloroflexi bacterium]|nr:MAG: response regulator transcription factor [Chloroflexota bacterium]